LKIESINTAAFIFTNKYPKSGSSINLLHSVVVNAESALNNVSTEVLRHLQIYQDDLLYIKSMLSSQTNKLQII